MKINIQAKLPRNSVRAILHITKGVRNHTPTAAPRALLVGGAVRDMLLGLKPRDIDIELFGIHVEDLKTLTEKLFPGLPIRYFKTFGVLHIGTTPLPISLSIPRTEIRKPTSHAGVVVQLNPKLTKRQSVQRRDFTINALLLDPESGTVYDYVDGLQDLKQKALRAVHTRSAALDPERPWRALELSERIGFWVAPATAAAFAGKTKARLSGPRIGAVLRSLFEHGKKPGVALEQARQWGLVEKDLPELELLERNAPAWDTLCAALNRVRNPLSRWDLLYKAAGPKGRLLQKRLQKMTPTTALEK